MHDRCSVLVCAVVMALCVCGMGDTWSDFVNSYEGAMNFSCPNNEAIAGVSSEFSDLLDDRQWKFYCTDADTLANSGGVNCTLQNAIHTPTKDITYTCPGTGFIGGFVSAFDALSHDRLWRPYCCIRRQASLINCKMDSSYANNLEGSLLYEIPSGGTNSGRRVVVGMEAVFNSVTKDRRWRFRHCEIEVTCPTPSVPANGQLFGSDFRFEHNITYTCNNSYYMVSGNQSRTCLNSGQFSGEEPLCAACTNITHCQDVRCTNATDHYCELCASNHGMKKGDTAYANRHTFCEALCSWKNDYCYPGMCPSTPATCQCSAGFSGHNCLTVSSAPTLLDCSISLADSSGNTVEGDCTSSLSSPVFTNVLPIEIDLNWNVMFQGPAPPSRPSYVVGYKVGVVATHLNATIRRAAALSFIVDSEVFACLGNSFSSSMPRTGPTKCADTLPLIKTFRHGDRYEFKVLVENGGYLVLRDHDLGVNVTQYYSGSQFIGHALFILDFLSPIHCSLTNSVDCLQNQHILYVVSPITRQGVSRILWGGWLDELSSLHSYQIDVYPLQVKGESRCEQLTVVVSSTTIDERNSSSFSHSIHLSNSGIYSIVMIATDIAGNHRYSRRLVLYDSVSMLATDVSKPIRVTSAVNETVNRWQTDLTKPITVKGLGHFYNTKLRTNKWLDPVCDFQETIDPDYDQPLNAGLLPRSGTPNADGIVKLEYAVGVDHKGGFSVTDPTSWSIAADVSFSNISVSVDRVDGDTAKFFFRATDYLGHEKIDTLLLNFDASPPTVKEPWLLRNGVQLALYHSTDLLSMKIQVEAEDNHSGIDRIEWMIGTSEGRNDVGNGRVHKIIQQPEDCDDVSCYCILTGLCYSRVFDVVLNSQNMRELSGRHDTDYFITAIVTNQAGLVATSQLKITIDTTPPQSGVVVDSTLGSKDIDYQSDLMYYFSWDGFFDPETDVLSYQYIADVTCASAANFSYPRSGKAIETQDIHGTLNATSPGKYFLTVVAYNKALMSSATVCSDGIVIDQTPPSLEQIFIEDLVLQPGLIQDPQNQVWLVLGDRRRKMVVSPSEQCFNNSLPVSDVFLYPIHQYRGVVSTVRAEECLYYRPLTLTSYITHTSYVAANWTASDTESGILDYEVGLGSTETTTPDVKQFISAGRHPFAAITDSNLKHGSQFYLIVKATNQALLSVTKIVGPIVVDTTSPRFTGQLNVKLELKQLLVSWTDKAFQDPEDQTGLHYQLAIGSSPNVTDVIDFCKIEMCFKRNGSSATISVDSLARPFHNGHTYHVFLQAMNGASLTKIVTASYLHQVNVPSIGVVHDVEPKTTSTSWWQETYGIYLDDEDIDLQTTNSSIAAQWFGFTHDYLPLTYEFGVGSSAYLDDVVAFKSVGSRTTHTETGLSLSNQKYYVTIRVFNDVGNVAISSDGVMVRSDLDDIIQREALVVDGWTIDSDVDYQSCQSELRATWRFPTSLMGLLSHYEWALYERQFNSSSEVRRYHSVASTVSALAAGLSLTIGREYYVSVRFCYSENCLKAVHSDGIRIVGAPVPTRVKAVYNTDNDTAVIQWEAFHDPKMSHYTWSIGTGSDGSQLLVPLGSVMASVDTMVVTVNVNMSAHYPAVVTVNGYNEAGVGATVSTDMEWQVNGRTVARSNVDSATMTIYDISSSNVKRLSSRDWRQLEHVASSFNDVQYVGYSDRLAAAWPTLRYPSYSWSLSESPLYVPCGLPGVVACGNTPANEVVSSNMQLNHGHRYYFCVWSNSTIVQHENFKEELPMLEECTNGVTIDLKPPLGGCVSVGREDANKCKNSEMEERQYQACTTEMAIFWSGFSDIEAEGTAVHASGIAYYEYAIGLVAGQSDVVSFTKVGAATRALASSLALRDGQVYYATVRAYDFVGLWTEAYSPAVVVDSSAPSVGTVTVGADPSSAMTHIESVREITVHWSRIEDSHSGTALFQWGLGSRVGHADLMPFTTANSSRMATTNTPLSSRNGQLIFVTVLATNKAGLSSVLTSPGYIVDFSPPSPGYVFDGPKVNGLDPPGQDLDYGSSLSELSAHWGGYYDNGTGIVEYQWAIGTCTGCTDVIHWNSAGLQTDGKYESLSLVPGNIYYSSVKACDGASFCSSFVTSDGLVVDNSPPIPGYVVDGITGDDKQYHRDRYSVSARWFGFHDPHSSLSYFELSVGTSPGRDDVLTWRNVHLSTTATETSLDSPLPRNRLLYVSVRAVNRAGLSVTRSSNGFIVDVSSPVVVLVPHVDVTWSGSLSPSTQFDRSQIKAKWQFSDSESGVTKHFWSVRSHNGAHVPRLPTVVADGDCGIMTGLDLNDGDQYTVTVTACNGASLCTTAVSQPVLVDSSGPSVGTFAVNTESAAMIDRSVLGSMTWSNHPRQDTGSVDMAWLGFSDLHSAISHYRVSISVMYAGGELDVSATPATVSHMAENVTQRAVISVNRRLVLNERLLVSIWAVNGVGLRSSTLTDTFTVVSKGSPQFGSFERERSSLCDVHTCAGHCTCAPHGQYCQSQSSCTIYNSTNVPSDRQIIVSDVVQGTFSVDADFTSSSCCMSAVWSLVGSGSDILGYEWSAGRKGKPVGSGVFDTAMEQYWFQIPTGTVSRATLVLPAGKQLILGVSYVFYVRVWYASDLYALFQSDGISVVSEPPSVQSGRRVKEVASTTGPFYDIDYTQSTSQLVLHWEGVFIAGGHSLIDKWRLCIGSKTGVCAVYSGTVPANESSTVVTGLTLTPGIRYYATVTAVSPLGLETSSTSDGIVAKVEKPGTGIVLDCICTSDARAQSSTSEMSASWHGFSDTGSYIHHYEWAIGQTRRGSDVMPFRDAGLSLSATLRGLNLTDGATYYVTVIAVDAVSIRSDGVSSNGVTVDTSPPFAFVCHQRSRNLVNNPSFEGYKACSSASSLSAVASGWTVGSGSWMRAVASSPYDGCYSLYFFGSLSQKVTTTPGTEYRLYFYASAYNDTSTLSSSISGTSATISIPSGTHTFTTQPTHHQAGSKQWDEFYFLFTAIHSETNIIFSSSGRSGIAIDRVSVDYCLDRRQENAGDGALVFDSDAISIGTRNYIGSSPRRIFTSWDIEDAESGISEYWFALGTVRGGEQLQRYTSVGRARSAVTASLRFQHGWSVYVSVLALNDADRKRVVHSRRFQVDFSYPQEGVVNDGSVDGLDIDYQSSTIVSANWRGFFDPESGIEECRWAIGSSPSLDDIQEYRMVPDVFNASRIGLSLSHGQRVYVRVICTNGAGLSSHAVSDGVTVVLATPSITAGSLAVSSAAPGEYDADRNVLAQTDSLHLSWKGFVDSTALLGYEVKFTGAGILLNASEAQWTDVGHVGTALVTGLTLQDEGLYTAHVRAVSPAGLVSPTVSTAFSIVSTPPADTGAKINSSWTGASVRLYWKGKFLSSSAIKYELSVGRIAAGTDVLKFTETVDTEYLITSSLLDRSTNFHILLTAISASGLHSTVIQEFLGFSK